MVEVKCPECGEKMKKGKHGVYVCENKDCDDKYIAVPKSIFKSIFGGK